MTTLPVQMKVHIIWRLLFIVELVAALVFAAFFFLSGRGVFGAVTLVCTLFVLYVTLLSWSRIEADNEQLVVVRPPYGTYALPWSEVTSALSVGSTVVLRGDRKTLGFNVLMGDGQAKALRAFVEQQLQAHGIALQQMQRLPKIPSQEAKNTRISTRW